MLTKGAFLFDQNNSKSKKKNSNIVNIAQETFQFSLMNRMFICNKNLLKHYKMYLLFTTFDQLNASL